jgi:hypothetical protein
MRIAVAGSKATAPHPILEPIALAELRRWAEAPRRRDAALLRAARAWLAADHAFRQRREIDYRRRKAGRSP